MERCFATVQESPVCLSRLQLLYVVDLAWPYWQYSKGRPLLCGASWRLEHQSWRIRWNRIEEKRFSEGIIGNAIVLMGMPHNHNSSAMKTIDEYAMTTWLSKCWPAGMRSDCLEDSSWFCASSKSAPFGSTMERILDDFWTREKLWIPSQWW